MVAADSGETSKGMKKLSQAADAGIDSAKAALAAVTSAVNPHKVIPKTTRNIAMAIAT